MGRRRGGGRGRGAGAAAARADEEAGSASASTTLETPLLQPPPPPPPVRAKKSSSSSCFLADGLHDDGGGGAAADADGERATDGTSTAVNGASSAATSLRQERRQQQQKRRHARTQRRLALALALAGGFMVAEVVGGFFANSLAIMSDAAHLSSDVVGFAVALAAGAASARRASPGSAHTYGHHRAEVLGALASTVATWAVTAALVVAAIGRLRKPEKIEGEIMFWMAVAGVFVNVLLLLVLGDAHGGHSHSHGGHSHSHGGHSHSHGGHGGGENGHAHDEDDRRHDGDDGDDDDEESARPPPTSATAASLNLRGAVLHTVGDLVQSVGVAVAGALVWYNPDWTLADPLATLFFAFLVILTTKNIAGELLTILMEAAPRSVDVAGLETSLLGVDGVSGVDDLHVWGLSSGIALATAHLRVAGGSGRSVVEAAKREMEAHGVAHCTIQVEEERGGGG